MCLFLSPSNPAVQFQRAGADGGFRGDGTCLSGKPPPLTGLDAVVVRQCSAGTQHGARSTGASRFYSVTVVLLWFCCPRRLRCLPVSLGCWFQSETLFPSGGALAALVTLAPSTTWEAGFSGSTPSAWQTWSLQASSPACCFFLLACFCFTFFQHYTHTH